MSTSFVVRWEKRVPTHEEILKALTQFVGADSANKVQDHSEDSMGRELSGKYSYPFEGINFKDSGPAHDATAESDTRWFEVSLFHDEEEKWMSVDTRRQDEFTMAVAGAFAQACARFWEGKYEPPS